MKPVDFEEANVLVCPPEGMEGLKIPMCKTKLEEGEPVIVSCWELSDEELAALTLTKRLWVVEHGEMHHPMAFTCSKPLQNQMDPLNLKGSQKETYTIQGTKNLGEVSIDWDAK